MHSQQRRDIGYSILSRFEESLRDYICTILPIHFPNIIEGIPSGIVLKIRSRDENLNEFELDEALNNTDFIDLSEIITFNSMFENYFSSELSISEFQTIMHDLYILRCKIAHVRGYFTSLDLDDLVHYIKKIAHFMNEQGQTILQFIEDLRSNPSTFITPIPESFSCDIVGVPNNLPTPDYEYEGGFVGRKDDIQKVIKLIESGLHRVVTISGAGGVGKTALALKAVYQLAFNSSKKYDGIIWVSAKENKLSYLGIEDIEPTIKNYDELLDTICNVMGFDTLDADTVKKEDDVNTILELYKQILIVIDNLETITDDRIIDFILDSDPKLDILITSRKGLGQVERRYELKQLKEKEAIVLFRLISKDKNMDMLARLDDDIISGYVNKLSCYPLAIKWVIGHVASGRDIHEVIDSIHESTSDISKFCFDHIYNGLAIEAKKILCALSVFDDPPAAGVLKYVVNINQDEFQDNIAQLILVSLIIPDQVKTSDSQVVTKYFLLPLTRGYVRQQLDRDQSLKREIDERFRAVFHTIEEADRAAKEYRFTLLNLGANSDEEKVAAMLAHTAHQKYEAGRYEDAVEDYKRALSIAPRFPSLYRNWAVMESSEGHSVEADKLMEKATKLAPDDAMVWLTWGNIKRKSDRIKDAQEYYDKALKLKPDDAYILNASGQAKFRLGEYAEAELLLRKAIISGNGENSTRHLIINKSCLAENFRRWAESLKRDRNKNDAEKKLLEALAIIDEVIELKTSDKKSLEIKAEILRDLGYLGQSTDPKQAIKYLLTSSKTYPLTRYKQVRDSFALALTAAHIFYDELHDVNNAQNVFEHYLDKLLHQISNTDSRLRSEYISLKQCLELDGKRLTGKIISVFNNQKHFYVEPDNSPGISYLGDMADLANNLDQENKNNVLGIKVSFIPVEKSNSKTKLWASRSKIVK